MAPKAAPPRGRGSLTTAQAAPKLGVDERTVRGWIRRGMPARKIKNRNGVPAFRIDDIAAALKWRDHHISPSPRNGGKLPGGGRPRKGAKSRKAAKEEGGGDASSRAVDHGGEPGAGSAPGPAAPPEIVLGREERIGLLRSGKSTKAQIQLTEDETRALSSADDYELKHGRLLDAGEVKDGYKKAFQRVRSQVDSIPAGAAREIASTLALDQAKEVAIRTLLEKQVARAYAGILEK